MDVNCLQLLKFVFFDTHRRHSSTYCTKKQGMWSWMQPPRNIRRNAIATTLGLERVRRFVPLIVSQALWEAMWSPLPIEICGIILDQHEPTDEPTASSSVLLLVLAPKHITICIRFAQAPQLQRVFASHNHIVTHEAPLSIRSPVKASERVQSWKEEWQGTTKNNLRIYEHKHLSSKKG